MTIFSLPKGLIEECRTAIFWWGEAGRHAADTAKTIKRSTERVAMAVEDLCSHLRERGR